MAAAGALIVVTRGSRCSWTRERIEAAGRVAFAATPQSALEAQFTMVRREMELFLERNARLAQLSAKAALDARQRIDETADDRRAA